MSQSDRPKPPPAAHEPDDPPTDEELRAAENLRRALEARESGAARRDTELVKSLRAAVVPVAISPLRHREILERALEEDRRVVPLRPPGRKIVFLAAGGLAGVLAMAAAIAIVVRIQERAPVAASGVASIAPLAGAPDGQFALSRSAAELFPEGIPRSGGTTARVDRIASARTQDLRQNQFARWRTR
jgi:hypothetical protein